MRLSDEGCRWGGPSSLACWDVSACGCRPNVVEEVWVEAHAEELRRLGSLTFDDLLARALNLPAVANWIREGDGSATPETPERVDG